MKEIFVVAGIIEHNDLVLCTQRAVCKYSYVSLKWEFPGGKIENGETKEQALKRELKEELDLDVKNLTHFVDVKHTYPDFVVNMYCFKCEVDSDNLKLNVHNSYKWLKKSELNLLDWAPADISVVQKYLSE